MKILNSIKGDVVSYLVDLLTCAKIKEDMIGNSDYSEYRAIVEVLMDAKYQTDFHLIDSHKEIEDLYNNYRLKYVEEGNHQIRFLLDLSTHIYSLLEPAEYDVLLTELSSLITLHSRVDKNVSVYDESICSKSISSTEWKILLFNNPWLVGCIMIKHLPYALFIHILRDSLQDLVMVKETEDET